MISDLALFCSWIQIQSLYMRWLEWIWILDFNSGGYSDQIYATLFCFPFQTNIKNWIILFLKRLFLVHGLFLSFMDPENLEKYEITQRKCAVAANLLDAFRPLPSERYWQPQNGWIKSTSENLNVISFASDRQVFCLSNYECSSHVMI